MHQIERKRIREDARITGSPEPQFAEINLNRLVLMERVAKARRTYPGAEEAPPEPEPRRQFKPTGLPPGLELR